MKVCLITCAKNEDDHIEEFLEHYFDIVGIDHIFWIDNNSEPLKPVVINDDRVTVIDKRDVNFDNGSQPPLFIMKDLVNEIYQSYVVGTDYDWCCYFDPDELLELPCKNIKEYLSDKDKYDTLLMPWVMHGNNNYIWEKELPSDRMKINYGYEDNYDYSKIEFKPIFRTKNEFALDIYFFDPRRIILNCPMDRICVDKECKLHHYRVQCIETYIKHKINNGFYGMANRAVWCKNIFMSSVFVQSNVRIEMDKYMDFYDLIMKYGLNNFMTKNDRIFLFVKYGFRIYTTES